MGIAGLGEIAEHVRRSTVLVEPGGRGSGSGVVWSSDGLTSPMRTWPKAGGPV